MHALRRRITRACRGEWGALWQEAIAAHKARNKWYEQNFPGPQRRTSKARRIARALKLASHAQYTRAMRALTNDPIADLNDPATHAKLQDLHPSPSHPTIPLSETDLPPAPEIDQSAVLRAVKRMNPNSAPGPDRMSPRLFHLLVNSQVSPEAGVTGLSALTRLVQRLARGHIPDQSLPLLAAATLIPIQPRPNKIRPIAIGQALRRLVTKVLLPTAIFDSKPYLAPEQLANDIPSAMDAIVHDARSLMRRHGRDPNFIMVSIDAKNAFNSCSRQQMLNDLTLRAPSLARFLNSMYARTTPQLVIPSNPPVILQSREGTQQGDPAGMLMFSITMQPLTARISQECNLSLNRWYADDGLLIGPIPEVKRALQILRDHGPQHNFYLNVEKTKAYWPSIDQQRISEIITELPLSLVTSGGLELLGAPVGSRTIMREKLLEKLSDCNEALSSIDEIPDARIKFHLHRMCGSACRVQHIFRLVPPDLALPYAKTFDDDQIRAYSRFNNIVLTSAALQQVRLPIRQGGHGFIPLAPLLYASYAASIIDSAPIRIRNPQQPSDESHLRQARIPLKVFIRKLPEKFQPPNYAINESLPNGLGHFEPQALLERPERTHTTLFQAYNEAAVHTFWQKDIWAAQPQPRQHSTATVRRRVRFHSLVGTQAASFISAHPSTATTVFSNHWSVMLKRHLDIPIYSSSGSRLVCSHCRRNMDARGDHATKCGHGFGYTHRHNNLRNMIARKIIKPAGLAYQLEAPALIPDSELRPADILVQPELIEQSEELNLPIAYDVTVRSPFVTGALNKAATQRAGGAAHAEHDKVISLHRNLRDALHLNDADPIPSLDWKFYPLAFDTYGAPAPLASRFIETLARRISFRCNTPYALAKQSVEQSISYTIWSSTAQAILSRVPSHLAGYVHPQHV